MTAGSSCTFRRATGKGCSSIARSFTSDARKMMYWYGSGTGGMYSAGGLQTDVTRQRPAVIDNEVE